MTHNYISVGVTGLVFGFRRSGMQIAYVIMGIIRIWRMNNVLVRSKEIIKALFVVIQSMRIVNAAEKKKRIAIAIGRAFC